MQYPVQYPMLTVYGRPYGTQTQHELKNIYAEDAAWFLENKVKLSAEAVEGTFAIYADIGFYIDGEPQELIELACGRNAKNTFKALREHCEAALSKE